MPSKFLNTFKLISSRSNQYSQNLSKSNIPQQSVLQTSPFLNYPTFLTTFISNRNIFSSHHPPSTMPPPIRLNSITVPAQYHQRVPDSRVKLAARTRVTQSGQELLRHYKAFRQRGSFRDSDQ